LSLSIFAQKSFSPRSEIVVSGRLSRINARKFEPLTARRL